MHQRLLYVRDTVVIAIPFTLGSVYMTSSRAMPRHLAALAFTTRPLGGKMVSPVQHAHRLEQLQRLGTALRDGQAGRDYFTFLSGLSQRRQ